MLKLVQIEPGPAQCVADKLDCRLNPKFTEQLGQVFGKAGQGIEQMRQTHEVVIAFHGVPVFCERMLVGIALVLLNEKSPFNAPAITSTEITAGMGVEPTDWAAGDPRLFVLFGDDLRGLGVDLLPLLGTDHHVDVDMVFTVVAYRVTKRLSPVTY